MSTTMLIPSVGAVCVAVAAMLLPARSSRPGSPASAGPPAETDERLVTVDEIDTLRAVFDESLVDRGLLSTDKFDTIRRGTRSRGVVTAMHTTGATREDYREVRLDLMVSRRGGGQFPVQDTALVPAEALDRVSPGSVVIAYYRSGDESSVAVCAPAS